MIEQRVRRARGGVDKALDPVARDRAGLTIGLHTDAGRDEPRAIAADDPDRRSAAAPSSTKRCSAIRRKGSRVGFHSIPIAASFPGPDSGVANRTASATRRAWPSA